MSKKINSLAYATHPEYSKLLDALGSIDSLATRRTHALNDLAERYPHTWADGEACPVCGETIERTANDRGTWKITHGPSECRVSQGLREVETHMDGIAIRHTEYARGAVPADIVYVSDGSDLRVSARLPLLPDAGYPALRLWRNYELLSDEYNAHLGTPEWVGHLYEADRLAAAQDEQ